jgi:hypothetical protein
VQGKHVLGQIDAEKQNGHGHPLPMGNRLRFRNPILAPGRTCRYGSNRSSGTVGGDVPFIR